LFGRGAETADQQGQAAARFPRHSASIMLSSIMYSRLSNYGQQGVQLRTAFILAIGKNDVCERTFKPNPTTKAIHNGIE